MLTKIVDSSFKQRVDSWGKYEITEFITRIENTIPHLKGKFSISDSTLIYTFWSLLERIPNNEIDVFVNFMEMYEKNQIHNVDTNQLKTIDEIEGIVNLINIKNIGKEFEKQTYVDLETEKWLVIRPLTYESSVKYGSNTKWCTSAKHNPNQYFRYTDDGVLVYCINKETGYKLAFHMWRENKKFYDISFWNSIDDRIDSLSAEIDFDVYNLIKKMHSSSETKTNKELGGEYWTKSFDLHMKKDDSPTSENYAIGHNRATLAGRVRDEILVTIDEPINDQLDWSAHVETVGE
jgi:hypothetical protein